MSNSHNSIKKDDSGEETNGLLSKRKGELSSIRERVKIHAEKQGCERVVLGNSESRQRESRMCVMRMTVREVGKEYNVNYLFSFLVCKYHIQDRKT